MIGYYKCLNRSVFVISSLKNFFISFISSLVASLVTTYALQIIQLGRNIELKKFLHIIINFKFILLWALLLILILLLRKYIFYKIEKLQTPYPMVRSVLSSYDIESGAEGFGFKWEVLANITNRNPKTNEILGIKVGVVYGPYCKDDYREMKISRTYYGGYKYKCPKCGYKRTLFKNDWTLKTELSDEIEADYRIKRNVNVKSD